jgi:GrpB-like predicted nucleotidyltransferase (UPF0157 family)
MSEKPDPLELVTVVDYDPCWPQVFAEESGRVRAALGDSAVAVEHIGSTAVPGLAAKPVIDVLAGLRTLDLTRAQIEAMEALGYEYLGEYGIPGRLFFHKGRPRSHHVHAVLLGSDLWQRHLVFRDFLRAHSDEAQRYGNLKRNLAAEVGGDRERYLEGKSAFVYDVQERARAWRRARVA